MDNQSLSDLELWAAIQKADEKAFKCFFDRHWRRVFTTVFSFTRDRAICLEIVDDIFLNLWLKRNELNIIFFKTYLTTSARYHIYRYLKSAKKNAKSHLEVYLEDDEDLRHLAVKNQADDNLLSEDLNLEMKSNLRALPKRCKEIFILSRMEALSNDEIAERLNISKRTVENQITSALQHLKVAFKPFLTILIASGIIDQFLL